MPRNSLEACHFRRKPYDLPPESGTLDMSTIKVRVLINMHWLTQTRTPDTWHDAGLSPLSGRCQCSLAAAGLDLIRASTTGGGFDREG